MRRKAVFAHVIEFRPKKQTRMQRACNKTAVLRHASSSIPVALVRWWITLPEAKHAVTACQSPRAKSSSFISASFGGEPLAASKKSKTLGQSLESLVRTSRRHHPKGFYRRICPSLAGNPFNSFKVQPGHRTATSCWQGAGLAEPHFMPWASAEDAASEATSSLRDAKHFPSMVTRF